MQIYNNHDVPTDSGGFSDFAGRGAFIIFRAVTCRQIRLFFPKKNGVGPSQEPIPRFARFLKGCRGNLAVK
jgi:hypothetical protein